MSLMVGYTNQSFQDVTDGAQSKQIFLDVTTTQLSTIDDLFLKNLG